MTGRDKFMKRLADLADPTTQANKALVVIADKIRADAHRSITAGSASGQSGGKHQHVRSKPGEPPNNEHGDLARSLVAEAYPEKLEAEVRAEAAHAAPLEFGTSKMAARPYMRPARDANRDFAGKVFAEAMKDFVRKSGK